ncbi:LysR family transcriptional regulator [Altericroceibacterium endophyticum]|uniref:LysR family transcriptional regulator n=1 Tax=Altericroceibacterium endophyticum TaxID=1808508 RepID=A0A6I4T5A0_9SPHN|nr:LysR family transcriptional regulator [Altericroceibacterium endophyticum]MXO65372.1 LysR family transcriptional regulator [Altericroceibacterium endophyticum]
MTQRSFNIRHFAAMAAVVRHGSVTKAARAIHLTQPALTQAIARLEGDLECLLFQRGSTGMTPTEPALLLAPRAEEALRQIGSSRVTGTQLRAFLSLARAGSYAAAAEATGLSPASLHRAVGDLSLALGQRLVDRRGRSVILTQIGQRRARGFGLAMAELRAGLAEVAAWQGKAAGRIVIGAMPLSRARWLPDAIARFVQEYPRVDIAVMEGSHAELSGPLRDGEIDMMLGALREAALVEDMTQEAIFEDRPALIMRAGHPLCATPRPSARQLLDYPWILPSIDTPLRQYWEDMLLKCGEEPPHVGIECGSVLAVRQLLLSGDALTLLSPDQLQVELDSGMLATLPPPQPVSRTIGVVTRAGWRPTPPQAAFITLLKEVA